MSTHSLRPNVYAGQAVARRRCMRVAVVCAATSTRGTSTPSSSNCDSTSVRILRYPDGHERRILYPAPVVAAPIPESDIEAEDSWSLWTQTDEDESIAWNECGLAGAACVVADPDPLVEELAVLHKRHPTSVSDMVKGCYQVLTGSPWLLPRPLFVLAQQRLTSEQSTLYCLQTRIQQDEVQDELAMVLKRPALATSLTFSRMKDGVVAFDRAEDAARYATCLEADLPGEVEVMEVDSRQLFLMTGDADAVVVYLPWSEYSPFPHQLAAALREGEAGGAGAGGIGLL